MSKLESKVIQEFFDRVDQENLTVGDKVICRVGGGMPHERVEEEFVLSVDGKAEVMSQAALQPALPQQASVELDQDETKALIQLIRMGIESLSTRSEARFLPDSVVGSITIEIDGEEETLYFLAEEEERVAQDKPIAPQMVEAIERLASISQQSLKQQGEDK